MNDFSISWDAPEDFTYGDCAYVSTDAKGRKDEEGKKSILTTFKVTDINGVDAKASIFFSGDKPEPIEQFCEVNGMTEISENKKLIPEDCIGKSAGVCVVAPAKNPKYKRVTEFKKGEMPPITVPPKSIPKLKPKEEFDDDIPF